MLACPLPEGRGAGSQDRTRTCYLPVLSGAAISDFRPAPAAAILGITGVLSVRDRQPCRRRGLRAFVRNLHTGSGLGWIWWLPVLASGLLPLLFILSGTSLWLIKRRNRARMGG